ncbi:chaperone protein dnaJ 15-like [Arachis ipaensis]|uniref:chaperone protein dnaJ 15-like n=1 Tax=Arachis ipaensis TaxID=130454 RepID=UPI000A2B8415|nr:chaperone protein dnaJ 15-like [Arachis ipaensis]
MAKDPERAFFKRLEGLQPCEVSEGDNFFKTASYTIEVVCEKSYEDTTQKLNDIEAQISRKRNELRQFEAKYRNVTICFTQSWLMVYQALARYQKVTERYVKEKQSITSSWVGYKIYLKKDKRRNKKAKFSCEESSDDEEEEAAAEIASEVNFADEISGINTGPPSPTSSNESSVTS